MDQEKKKEEEILDKWDILQKEICIWAENTFGPRKYNISGILHHLKEEIKEIEEKPDDIEEFADAFILLMEAAWNQDFLMEDIYNAAENKLEKNKKRKWGTPDKKGIIRHVKCYGAK